MHLTVQRQDAQTPGGWEPREVLPATEGPSPSRGPVASAFLHCGQEEVAQLPSALEGTRARLGSFCEGHSCLFPVKSHQACLTDLGHLPVPMLLFSDHQAAFINNLWEILSRSQCCLPFHSGNRQGVQQSQYPPAPKG